MPKRRANGEGSIFSRKDKDGKIISWAAEYTDNSGKRRTLYGKTQQAVKNKLKEAIRESDGGMQMDKSKILFSDWMVEWLELYARPVVRESTYALYYILVHGHIVPGFKKVLLKDLRPDMIQRFLKEKRENGRIDGKGGLSNSRIWEIKKLMNTAIKQAEKNEIISKNPVSHVKLPPEAQNQIDVLTREQQKKIEAAILASDYHSAEAMLLALYTGMRIGEICALRIQDIDLDNKVLHVRGTKHRVRYPELHKTAIVVNEPKTEKSRRTIPLTDFTVDMLRQYIKKRKTREDAAIDLWQNRGEIERNGGTWVDHGFLFVDRLGNAAGYDAIRRRFYKIACSVGVDITNFHALRHSFATRCIEAGFDVKSLSDILGHSDAKMTLNTYSHALDEQKRLNMDKLSMLYKPNSDSTDPK